MPAWHAVPVQAATPRATQPATPTHIWSRLSPSPSPSPLPTWATGSSQSSLKHSRPFTASAWPRATPTLRLTVPSSVSCSVAFTVVLLWYAQTAGGWGGWGWKGGVRGEWARGWAQSRGGWRPRTQLMPAWGQHCPARLPPVPKHSPSPWVTLTVRVPSSLRPSVSGMGAGAAACSGWEELVWRVTRRAGGTQAPSGGAQPPHRTPAPCLQAPKPPPSCSLSAHPEQAAGGGLAQRGGGKDHRAGAGGHRQGRGSAASRQVTSGVAGRLHLLLRQFCMGARDGAKSRCGGLSKGGQRGGTGLTHHKSTQVGCSISDPPTRQPYPSQP